MAEAGGTVPRRFLSVIDATYACPPRPDSALRTGLFVSGLFRIGEWPHSASTRNRVPATFHHSLK